MLDLSLFPSKEEWGTGDEAMDSKLSIALKKTATVLSFQSITDFYFLGISLKPRTHNPGFLINIEFVVKALFYNFDPLLLVDHCIKKMKGQYYSKNKLIFDWKDKDLVLSELKNNKKYRYKNQIDFSIGLHDKTERNPFVRKELLRSSMDLSQRIIFKDFASFLKEESSNDLLSKEPLFQALKGGRNILVIEEFAEIWFNEDQVYSLTLFKEQL